MPPALDIGGSRYHLRRILAESSLSVNLLYTPDKPGKPDQVVKISHMPGLLGWLLWPFLLYLSWREYRIYRRLDGLEGIPALGPRLSRVSFAHEYVPGQPLGKQHLPDQLPQRFFDQLAMLLASVHRRRVFYADLDKRDNILVGEDGRPYLFDFQASFSFRAPHSIWGKWTDRLLQRLKKEDLYHLYKHKRRFQPGAMTSQEHALARRSGFSRFWKNWLMKPWKKLRAMLMPRKGKQQEAQEPWQQDSKSHTRVR